MRTPDFEQMLLVLHNEKPSRPTLFEFYMNENLYNRLAGYKLPKGADILSESKWIADAYKNAGYDYATIKISRLFNFPTGNNTCYANTISLNEGSIIKDTRSFEAYQWPDAHKIDFSYLSELRKYMPKGMKIIIPCSGPQETLINLIGFDNLCYMFYENPKLIDAVMDNIGERLVGLYERILEYPAVGSAIVSDDWGHKTQTMFSPQIMRKLIIPWHKKIVDLIHQTGRPAVLHSCGNIKEVMGDVINIGYDAKHSFEDAIQKIEEAYLEYGNDIALLGGIDVDFLCGSTPNEIFERSRNILEQTKSSGYALGSGNSIPDYVPFVSYHAMIKAAF